MKIVIDTNVLISALLWQGPSHKLLMAVEKRLFTLCMTPALLEELKDVLKRPKFFSRLKKHNISCEDLFSGITDIVALYPDIKIDSVVKDDPSDDKVLACALASAAKYIITGDPHILQLKVWSGVSILTPRQSLMLLSNRSG